LDKLNMLHLLSGLHDSDDRRLIILGRDVSR
jgi:hypothetical protein